MSETAQTSLTPDFSDYLAAIKRRRMLLAIVALPIVACALALAIGMPDIFVSTGLITFSDATVSGELPDGQGPGASNARRSTWTSTSTACPPSVLSPRRSASCSTQVPGLVEPRARAATMPCRTSSARPRVETVKVPVLDPDTGREREIISAFTVSYDSRDPVQAQKVADLADRRLPHGEPLQSAGARQGGDRSSTTRETEKYRSEIAQAEAKLAQFKAKNFGQLPELTDLNLNLLDRTQRDLDDVGQQIARAAAGQDLPAAAARRRPRTRARTRGCWRQLQAEYNKKLATYDENHPDMIALRRQIDALKAGGGAVDSLSLPAQLQAQKAILAQARQRYSEDHPDVKRIERQIKTLADAHRGR